MSEVTAYPLAWPGGWRRISPERRLRSRFGKEVRSFYSDGATRFDTSRLTVADGVERVVRELMRFGARDVVISTNVRLTIEGLPSSKGGVPADPGVAVYWKRRGKRECIAADQYDRVADNLAAVAATLDAMRAIDRHGGPQILDRAFTGFVALPAPEQPWQVLGLDTSHPTRAQVEDAHRRLAMKHHPDRGGDTHEMGRINAARDALMESL